MTNLEIENAVLAQMVGWDLHSVVATAEEGVSDQDCDDIRDEYPDHADQVIAALLAHCEAIAARTE